MDTSGDSSLDTANGTAASVAAIASVVGSAASLTIKAERPDHLAGTSTSPALAAGPISTGSSLFTGIANSNKTTRPDDWLATNSPESPQSSLQSQHVVYTSASQQLSEPPVAHSSPHQQQVSNNGYASPMSTGSYDPYSPNGKIESEKKYRKVEEDSEMMQTMPRIPTVGIRRRWEKRCMEVSYMPNMRPEIRPFRFVPRFQDVGTMVCEEDVQFWDLDLHPKREDRFMQRDRFTKQTYGDPFAEPSADTIRFSIPSPPPPPPPTTVSISTNTTELTNSDHPTSSFPVSTQGRDELSQSGSINGYGNNSGGGNGGGGGGGSGSGSSEGCDSKKRKGPTPRQQEELCLVCGDRASGYHYNALTCEGCKGFFRRSITRNAVYQCKYGNGCEIDMYMRRKCQECRLKKCLTVGMRPECVVPEYQCAVKRKEKKAQKEKDKPNSTTMNGSPGSAGMSEQVGVKMEPAEAESLSMSGSSGILTPVSPYTCVKPISPEQEELINRLVSFQCEFEQPSEDDLKRITNQPMEGEDPSDYSFRHITEITILTVQLIVEFSKRLPGFNELMREDQITLLKACSSEVMMLRMARKYDVHTDSIIFANNQPYTRDSYNVAGMGDTIEDLLRFCRQMYAMRVNNAEYALLTAIVIFSERPNLVECKKVEKLQEIYLKTLKAYVDNRRRPKSGTIFAKLLSVLTELRTLGNQNSEMCLNLKFKNKKLPVFLAEIWDVMP